MTQPLYAIGDIHGQLSELERALALVEADGGPEAPIIFLGDYSDRGPDSRGVLDRLIAGRDAGRPWRFILGNHDRMLVRFYHDCEQHDENVKSGKGWFHSALGGDATLASYGIDGIGVRALADIQRLAIERIPRSHIEFLESLPLWIEDGPHLFVHAGIRPGVPLEEQAEDDLIWIREGFLDFDGDFGWLVVHGHTMVETPTHFGNRIDIDGGAGAGRPLVPCVFDGGAWHRLTDRGRAPLAAPA
ncbi:serine/threonine protein phosphatase [Histidinibacterium aquaticum]|uniref:Serine/threonine protein phosphatase n=1 Tax=Histidinibacterium aquaticum TaxID=2613962 RepID=A0A5J5GG87_9RHOB|nr:serine/threonine protein phosphatase [Histidinibacterium aquaticum]